MFSSCRTQPAQYCGVMINRGRSDKLAPPRCQSVPFAIASDPDGIIIFTASGRLPGSRSVFGVVLLVKSAGLVAPSTICSSHRWLPGMTSVLPFLEAMRIFGRVFLQLYGQTEAPQCITCLRKIDHDPSRPERLGSCGRPNPLVDVRLFDRDMKEAEIGEPGEICVRGSLVMQGYWKRPSATEDAFRGGLKRLAVDLA